MWKECSIFALNMMSKRMWNNTISSHRCFTLPILVCLFFSCLSCTTKSPIEKWHEMYDKEWAQSQLDSILSPYFHMNWDETSLTITFSDVVPPIIKEYGTCKEYGNEKLEVYSVWSLPFDNADDAYPMSLYVRHGDVTILSKASDGTINIELDSIEFENAVREFRQTRQAEAEEKKMALAERKNAVNLANKNKTRVHFGMSSKDYYDCNKLFLENFVNGLIGDGAFNSHFEPYIAKGKFVGFEVTSTNFDNMILNSEEIYCNVYNQSHRYTMIISKHISDLYNASVTKTITKGTMNNSPTINIKMWWNGYAKIYTR